MNFNETLPDNIDNVAIYFYNDSCAPCVALRPKVQELFSAEFPKLPLVFINATKHPMLTAQYQIFASPTLLVFFDGKEYVRESKYIAMNELEQKVSRIYEMVFGDV